MLIVLCHDTVILFCRHMQNVMFSSKKLLSSTHGTLMDSFLIDTVVHLTMFYT